MRKGLVVVLSLSGACSHAPVPAASARVERRDDWLLALRSDVDRIAAGDGFEGGVRVLHGGKAEIDRTFGEQGCLPLGAGRRALASVTVGVLVEGGKLGFDDRLEQRLPSVRGSSFALLTVASVLTDSAGLAASSAESLEQRLEAAARLPLQAPPGTRVDPDDERPWLLVERLVAQVSGESFERFVEARVTAPAGMAATSLGPTTACPGLAQGVTTLEDQLRLIDALRAGKLVKPSIRDALWEPRLPLGAGSDVGYGFFIRTRGEQRAVGLGSTGAAPAYELWLDPAGTDALVLLGRTPARTARGIKTALGEFYALPPGAPHPTAPARRPPAR